MSDRLGYAELDSYCDNGATPFRGGKGATWEGGVRVPGIASWKANSTTARSSNVRRTVMLLSDALLNAKYAPRTLLPETETVCVTW